MPLSWESKCTTLVNFPWGRLNVTGIKRWAFFFPMTDSSTLIQLEVRASAVHFLIAVKNIERVQSGPWA